MEDGSILGHEKMVQVDPGWIGFHGIWIWDMGYITNMIGDENGVFLAPSNFIGKMDDKPLDLGHLLSKSFKQTSFWLSEICIPARKSPMYYNSSMFFWENLVYFGIIYCSSVIFRATKLQFGWSLEAMPRSIWTARMMVWGTKIFPKAVDIPGSIVSIVQ